MKKKDYNKIMGKTKKEVIDFFEGDQFNDPHSDLWTFFLGQNFLGRRSYLHVIFNNGVVSKVVLRVRNFWQ